MTRAATAPANDAGFFLSTSNTAHVTDVFLGSATLPQLIPGPKLAAVNAFGAEFVPTFLSEWTYFGKQGL